MAKVPSLLSLAPPLVPRFRQSHSHGGGPVAIFIPLLSACILVSTTSMHAIEGRYKTSTAAFRPFGPQRGALGIARWGNRSCPAQRHLGSGAQQSRMINSGAFIGHVLVESCHELALAQMAVLFVTDADAWFAGAWITNVWCGPILD